MTGSRHWRKSAGSPGRRVAPLRESLPSSGWLVPLATDSKHVASAAASNINKLLIAAFGEARDLARGLGPVGMDQAHLDIALEALAFNVQHLFRISCKFECNRPVVRPGHEGEAHLFRIAQKAVNNPVIHGRAKRIKISLSTKDGAGILSIRDDGVGLPEGARYADGIGLHTMAYRARLIRARSRRLRRSRHLCRAALDAILASKPDLVIVDLVLEGCAGQHLADRQTSSARRRDIHEPHAGGSTRRKLLHWAKARHELGPGRAQ